MQGFQRNDTTSAAHAIANATPNGQASDTLGQLYAKGKTYMAKVALACLSSCIPDSTLTCMHGRRALCLLCEVPCQHILIASPCFLLREHFTEVYMAPGRC